MDESKAKALGIREYVMKPIIRNKIARTIRKMMDERKEGLETIIELKQNFPDSKIIAISGGGRLGPEKYLSMAKKLGAGYTFSKPV